MSGEEGKLIHSFYKNVILAVLYLEKTNNQLLTGLLKCLCDSIAAFFLISGGDVYFWHSSTNLSFVPSGNSSMPLSLDYIFYICAQESTLILLAYIKEHVTGERRKLPCKIFCEVPLGVPETASC